MVDPAGTKDTAEEATRIMREYMVTESIQQFKDYYETDAEEQSFFEFLDNLSNRDKLRFSEIFDDQTLTKNEMKDFVMIPKREQNPELSVFSNFVLDLVDFKDRVRPMARDVAQLDVTRQYQKGNMKEYD